MADDLSRRDALFESFGTLARALETSTASTADNGNGSAPRPLNAGSQSTSAGPHGSDRPSRHRSFSNAAPSTASSSAAPQLSRSVSANKPGPSLSSSPPGASAFLNRVGATIQTALQASPTNGAAPLTTPSGAPAFRRSAYRALGPVSPVAPPGSGRSAPSPYVETAFNLARPPPEQQPPTSRTTPWPSLNGLEEGGYDEGVDGANEHLPGYAPRRCVLQGSTVRYQHSLSSTSNKMELVLESAGSKQHPVYVQELCPTVSGRVLLKLGGDASVNELRIRVKGVVTTAIKRTQSNARGLGEEEEFWYASSLLWTATEQQPTLDMTKEVHEFPFSLTIPPIVPTSARIRKQFAMPPSFVLSAPFAYPGGVDSASIRYYVKVTMARKGFLRPNERLFAPIVYLARETDISFMSNARRAALVQSIPLPSPLEAPDDWESRSEERQVRKGLFGIGKKTAYKAALLLPKPLVFGKLETLPFYVELSSDDNATLNKLGPASIVVRLVQRTTVWAQGAPGHHDTVVCKGKTDIAVNALAGATDAGLRHFKGSLSLVKAPASTFSSFNLAVQYFVTLSLLSDMGLETLATVPILLVSIPPVARNAAEVQRNTAAQASTGAVRRSLEVVEEDEGGELPPDYFDVVDTRDGR